MKKYIYYSIFFISSILLFIACEKDDTSCHDPQIVNWYNSSNLWLLSPFKIGDTLNYRVYHKDTANGGKYKYINSESFIVSDTITIRQKDINSNRVVNCNEYVINNDKILNFKGLEKLQCQLDATSLTNLDIFFKEKDFKIGALQYPNHKSGWLDHLNLGGKDYYDIKLLYGFDLGDKDGSGYKDSSIVFYNLEYGIIKAIVNDSSIYIRKP